MTAAGGRPGYKRLFAGHLLALLGSGVGVVALTLLAFELAGEKAAPAVIATALTLKTAAYVVGAPLAASLLAAAPRRPLMVALDLFRAGIILLLPFAGEVWRVLALILAFTLASAAFIPAYQASVPALLTDARDYARSLSRSRVAGELEGAVSPLIAAALLALVGLRELFVAAALAFVASAALVAATRVPQAVGPATRRGALDGLRLLAGSRALRGLPMLALAAGLAAGAVTVNTAPLVMGVLGREASDAALALAAFGGGSVAGALLLPRAMRRAPARGLMLAGGALTAAALALSAGVARFPTLLALWALAGFGVALAQTPAGLLIREATAPGDHQVAYAASFAASNAALGVGYAAAGALDSTLGLSGGALAMAAATAAAATAAAVAWRARTTTGAGGA